MEILNGCGISDGIWVFTSTANKVAVDVVITDMGAGEKKDFTVAGQGNPDFKASFGTYP